MKMIVAIIKPSRLDAVLEAVTEAGASGLTVTEVRGYGRQRGKTEVYRGAEYEVKLLPKVKLEIAVPSDVVDAVIEVADAASCAGAWLLEEISGRRFGGSSGTNLVASLTLACRMHAAGKRGSIVTLLCDRGDRYADTIFDRAWLAHQGLHIDDWVNTLRMATATGALVVPDRERGEPGMPIPIPTSARARTAPSPET